MMKKLAGITVFLTCFFVLVMFVGCSGAKLPTEYITGIVTLDGNPVEGASILFSPTGEGGALPAGGTMDKKGKYVITSMQGGGHGAGAVVGNYIVLISKEESTFVDGPQPRYDVKQVLPRVYGDVEVSPLRAEVEKGKNTIDFPLLSDPGIEWVPPERRRR